MTKAEKKAMKAAGFSAGEWTASIGSKGARIHVGNDANHPLSFGFNWPEMNLLLAREGAANARLIISAPEMFRILTGLSQLDSGPDEPGALAELREAARAVLVKLGTRERSREPDDRSVHQLVGPGIAVCGCKTNGNGTWVANFVTCRDCIATR